MKILLRPALICIATISCSADVATDYSAKIDYSQFKTYQFADRPGNIVITLDSARVEDAIKGQLYMKGLTLQEKDADLTVKHYLRQQSDFHSYGTSIGFGYRYRSVGVAYSSPSRLREYRYGKLIVELIDNSSNQIVWRSISQRKLTETMNPGAREKFIDEQIIEMFKDYPPKQNNIQ